MPEVVLNFSNNRDFNQAREIQRRILDAYEQDFSKHAPTEIVPRIRMLWLTDCGLVHRVYRASAPSLPLKAYEDEDLKAFKLFLPDVGLLSCMTRLRQDVLLDGNDLFREFKGALIEFI